MKGENERLRILVVIGCEASLVSNVNKNRLDVVKIEEGLKICYQSSFPSN